mmetsp:Transcript_8475/g.28822  ORF Transcript_8475/g.28822 Transcript_8475/m.28822 type:complete len:205 (+) Transcript_8475:356-970(+)
MTLSTDTSATRTSSSSSTGSRRTARWTTSRRRTEARAAGRAGDRACGRGCGARGRSLGRCERSFGTLQLWRRVARSSTPPHEQAIFPDCMFWYRTLNLAGSADRLVAQAQCRTPQCDLTQTRVCVAHGARAHGQVGVRTGGSDLAALDEADLAALFIESEALRVVPASTDVIGRPHLAQAGDARAGPQALDAQWTEFTCCPAWH